MRVLMISPELPRAEVPGSVKTMAATVRQIDSLRELGLTIDVIDMHGIDKVKYLQAIPRVRRLAKQADIIHAHFGFCGWLAHLAPKFARVKAPLVISFMGSDILGYPINPQGDLDWFSTVMVRANKRLAYKAKQVIVKSQEMADVVAPVPATVIPNGVDIDAFRPQDQAAARKQLDLPANRKLVLFPGNPNDPRKGHQLAAAAVDLAAQRIGQPIDIVPLKGVQPDQVPVYMNACDVMVMTSLIEGSPNVVKEAMACDTKVIGVPVGDVQQMLDGVAGCEFCSRDPEVIGSAIVRALENEHVGSREAILQRGLDSRSIAMRVIEVYEQALGQKIPVPTLAADSEGESRCETRVLASSESMN